ncbi:uncharacterized protein SPPG_01189 [Spizellomyces punctatus DAOM BR117]|uniref:Uncharacterized protein n=1 Tax=Spizellomyces punctatus (strain DAOM BR117) TaxID=645134 RepID=A0A0L0HS52_SPIPD|nr:uncharacterized protein SPPG_01189 [Spizellomyces punctatus DAOM BR117]KND03730.1 hypothetical protein SPPG_01189 [Spizellomyces punctatus DAOM BR117]|eukprot:XP_016611769.1 hypothetical protein SPPG_01189 [Spizellomyces punctatus DAOM BR117]
MSFGNPHNSSLQSLRSSTAAWIPQEKESSGTTAAISTASKHTSIHRPPSSFFPAQHPLPYPLALSNVSALEAPTKITAYFPKLPEGAQAHQTLLVGANAAIAVKRACRGPQERTLEDVKVRQAAIDALQTSGVLALYLDFTDMTPTQLRSEITRYLSCLPSSFPRIYREFSHLSINKAADAPHEEAHANKRPRNS